jgi:hypothetical protein
MAILGQKIYGDVFGRRRERASVIGALMGKKFIAPFTFQGGCNTDVFNVWVEQVLLKEIPQGTTGYYG